MVNERTFEQKLNELKNNFTGDLFWDEVSRTIYSTDASVYKEKPLAVALPKTKDDIKALIDFARLEHTSIIPRTAGTSLAGQVVGAGIIVDCSKYMNKILELNVAEKWVKVEPGVVLDELLKYLQPHGLFFGPETSTSNRCMIGGMLGNNSCGAHSIIYGSVRDHTLAVEVILSDGQIVEFGNTSPDVFEQKCLGEKLENRIYRNIKKILSSAQNQENIRKEYPKMSIHRRNNGYAIDLLLESEIFTETKEPFNFSKLIAGSEGTLAFITEIKLNLIPLPPKEKAIIPVHLNALTDAFKANLIALKYSPGAVELMDKFILDCTKENIEQQKNRWFIQGDPAALLIVEFARETKEEIVELANKMESDMKANGYGYHFPVIWGTEISKVWSLRKAGLGVLSNIPGDAKPVTTIEDTAVDVNDMPAYMEEFQKILDKYSLRCVFHAHIGSGELHLRPVLNLKDPKDVQMFETIAIEIAHLVKKYGGSISGEHGDGRLRGHFIPFMVGEQNYQLIMNIKRTWDAENIFNPGKIVNTPPMTKNLRYEPGLSSKNIETIFDFSREKGILRAAENCNGSADCRKSAIMGGTMCPSFMATKDEHHVTRARANVLREYLTNSQKVNPFDHQEIYEIMDLCLSCKACKAECPSNVDVAKLKAEFLQHYYDANGVPLRARMVGNIARINAFGSKMTGITNFFLKSKITSGIIKKMLGFSNERKIPALSKISLEKWIVKKWNANITSLKGRVYFFVDEFTNFNDSHVGIAAILLLNKLGYEVVIPKHLESGRSYLSKGLVRKAKSIAEKNISLLSGLISAESPLIGIEPSAILAFRDEYPDLVKSNESKKLAKCTFMIDEFLAKEMQMGNIQKDSFTKEKLEIKLHGHCQQKAVASTNPTKFVLSFPENYSVTEIPSGCCGMAGSFGYEKEHYDISMKVGELVLFPTIRQTPKSVLIAAPGTSCRHQIADGTGREAKHPVEILYEALVD